MKATRKNEVYGYIRISDPSQNIGRQLDFMKELGIDEKHIFIDKRTGKDFNRPQYKKLLRKLKPGDVLYVKELDRLGRNKQEIKKELEKLRDRNIRVRIRNIPTTLKDHEEMDWILDMVNNILIEVLASIAEEERETIRKRQAEGIAAAHARGVKFGRPRCTYPDNWEYYYTKWENGEMERKKIMQILNISANKFGTYVRSWRQFHVDTEIKNRNKN